jgi:hypothetical protein
VESLIKGGFLYYLIQAKKTMSRFSPHIGIGNASYLMYQHQSSLSGSLQFHLMPSIFGLFNTTSYFTVAAVWTGLILLNLTVTALATFENGRGIFIAQLRNTGKKNDARKASACLLAFSASFSLFFGAFYLTTIHC